MKNEAVLYLRVSTKEQTKNLSLPTQRDACRAYCEREGLVVAREFTEAGESAKTADRLQLQELLKYCKQRKRRIASVVVYNVSRFSRDTNTHMALRGVLAGCGINLRSVTEPINETSTGKLMEGILSVFSQFENDHKADRTKAGMSEALRRGKWTFIAQLGYRTGHAPSEPSLVIDEPKATLIRSAFEDIARGNGDPSDLLRRVTAQGLRTRRGKTLCPQSWHKLLRNPIYMGRVESRGLDVSGVGDFEPLVDAETFEQVQWRLAQRKKGPRLRRKHHPDYPLTRFLRCAKCHTSLSGSASKGRTRKYPYYHCGKCSGVRTSRTTVETLFLSLLDELQPDSAYLELFREVVRDVWERQAQSAIKARDGLRRRIEDIGRREDALEEAFIYQRRIDPESYEKQRDKLREDMASLETAYRDASLLDIDLESTLTFAEHLVTRAGKLWSEATGDQKRRLQQAFFPEGLEFNGEQFGTAVTCLGFKDLREFSTENEKVASPTGVLPFTMRGAVAPTAA